MQESPDLTRHNGYRYSSCNKCNGTAPRGVCSLVYTISRGHQVMLENERIAKTDGT